VISLDEDACKGIEALWSEIPREEVRWHWSSGHYDGPRSGVMIYKGEKLWVECYLNAALSEDAEDSRFVLFRLTAEQLAEQEKWHRLFQENLGMHTDYDESGKRLSGGPLNAPANPTLFWDAPRKDPELSPNAIIGWFRD
jgi:hypothetical protein